ncbi:MAG TPA: class III extradiol ring-cleavage dioxygenase [Limnobacter sp.]|uniref:DODA-type extradiol aromatic ring-opening family dioxygenase n=1 Tax=Limnobacter sp. TaxID=2003368 RepID=UPI002ED83E02
MPHNTAISALFISHGAPTFALEPGAPGEALEAVGQRLLTQHVRALIVVSPHWRSQHLQVTTHAQPAIVHDFFGFPKALYGLNPLINGDPALALQLVELLALRGLPVEAAPQQGFDHGVWVPYLHLFPQGGPPVVQLSMPVDWTAREAFATGQALSAFAHHHRAVVVGSGSLTHNFSDLNLGGTSQGKAAPTYVNEFTRWIGAQLEARNSAGIAQADQLAPNFHRAHPDDDHYLPLPFAVGAAAVGTWGFEELPEDVRYGALSMQSHVFTRPS